MSLPVVVVTLYRRTEATRRFLSALSDCYGVDELPIYLSCDHAPEHADACKTVYEGAREWRDWSEHHFPGRRVTVKRHDQRLGIDRHKLHAVPAAMEWANADRVILLEDDTGLSADALCYFATMLKATEGDPEILAICGFNRWPMDNRGPEDAEAAWRAIEADLYGTYRHDEFKSWGWGMHRATWERLFGDGGKRYASEVHAENGCFDWWLTLNQCRDAGVRCVLPRVARTNHLEWRDATHTQRDRYEQEERATVGAWNVVGLEDPGLLWWGKSSA